MLSNKNKILLICSLGLLLIGLVLLRQDMNSLYETEEYAISLEMHNGLCSGVFEQPLVSDPRVFHGLRMGWYNNSEYYYHLVINCCINQISGVVRC